MPAKLYRVNLTEDEREHLLGITRRGKSSGRKVKRSLILCKADEGLTDQQVAEALMVGPARRGCPCRGRDNGPKPWVPDGRCDCLPTRTVKLELTDSISRETVRQVLKKTKSSRGGRRSGAFPR